VTAVIEQSFARFLKCRECGKEHPPTKLAVCEDCFAPIDMEYDFDSIKLNRKSFINRPRNIWRYRELLPIENSRNIVDLGAGCTPLVKCVNLGEHLGLSNLYIKNDTVNPTYSFKDRPASVAVSKALEFKDRAVGCASTGNLAGAVAAHAGKAGLQCYVLAPSNTERSKFSQVSAYGGKILSIDGTYDDANRLAVLASEEFGWNIVNVTSRPYYVEGSKTMAFEVAEQLGWKTPDQIIIPVASGALLCAMHRGFHQFNKIGLIDDVDVKVNGAQASGCGPVAQAFANRSDSVIPVENPNTIAKSIAIGDPGDGVYVLQTVRSTGGIVGGVSDKEIIEAIKLLARCEGVFSEPAGGVTVALLKKMVEEGKIDKDEITVCCITGNGLKTGEGVIDASENIIQVEATLDALTDKVSKWDGLNASR